MKLSDKLIKLRKESGWSQEEFAEKLDVSRQAISRWENGTALPDAKNVVQISKLFNVTTDYLLYDDYDERISMHPSEAPAEIPNEETPMVPSETKRKQIYWYLIPAVCLIILTACVVIATVLDTDGTKEAGHSHDVVSCVKENEVAATCAKEGSYDEVVYCTECEEELGRAVKSIPKLAHALAPSVKENETLPTCTARGFYDEVVYCAECRVEVLRTYRTIEKADHQYKDGQCIVCEAYKPTESLIYMSNGDGTCFVDGGECTDENVVIPEYSPSGDRVVQIKAGAFWGNDTIKTVQIPETVTDIGERAFMDCSNLEYVNLPKKLKYIHSYTFRNCENLKEITIPDGVSYIGVEAFRNCKACESVFIPASVVKIGKDAFTNFSNCEGTVTFAVYSGWWLYDDEGRATDPVNFQHGAATPVLYLTFLHSDHTWKRE